MFGSKNYDALLRELYSLRRLGIRPALAPVRALLKALGDPHKKVRYVHVAGTNGKGSTVAMTAKIFQEAGYKTGAFFSPHVSDYRERMQITPRMIPKKELAETLREMGMRWSEAKSKNAGLPEKITFFEWTTALAFYWFARKNVDVAVLETGMGGRLDATNVVTPLVSVITNITHEHSVFLGGTKAAIAREKAGIIKRGRPVVLGDKYPSVRSVISGCAKLKKSPLYASGVDFSVSGRGIFKSAGKRLKLKPAMYGSHQLKNAALAAQAALLSGLEISDENIRNGVASATLPGRFELAGAKREIVLDAAHNPAAFRELKKNLTRFFGNTKFDFVMGILSGKDVRAMMKTIAPVARRVLCVTPDDPRALTAKSVAQTARDAGIESEVLKGVRELSRLAGKGDVPLVVTGSFTTLAIARKALGG